MDNPRRNDDFAARLKRQGAELVCRASLTPDQGRRWIKPQSFIDNGPCPYQFVALDRAMPGEGTRALRFNGVKHLGALGQKQQRPCQSDAGRVRSRPDQHGKRVFDQAPVEGKPGIITCRKECTNQVWAFGMRT